MLHFKSDIGHFGQIRNWKLTEFDNSCITEWVMHGIANCELTQGSVAADIERQEIHARSPLRVRGATKWYFLSVRVLWRTSRVMDLPQVH